MKKIMIITAIAALLISVFSISTWAFGGPNNCGKQGFRNPLNLTADQEQKILQIRQDFQKDTLTLRFDLQKKNLELRQLNAANPANQGAVNSKTKEIENLRTQLQNKQKAMDDKIKAILTPDQVKQFESMRGNRNQGFRGMGKRGGCNGCAY